MSVSEPHPCDVAGSFGVSLYVCPGPVPNGLTLLRARALQNSRLGHYKTGHVCVKQHPGDAQLSLDELRDMVGREGEEFSNHVLAIQSLAFDNNTGLYTF